MTVSIPMSREDAEWLRESPDCREAVTNTIEQLLYPQTKEAHMGITDTPTNHTPGRRPFGNVRHEDHDCDPESNAGTPRRSNTERTDTPPTIYTDETPLARVLELLEETASDLVDFASVIQERLNQVLDQRIPAFSDHEQGCRQAESPLVDRLHRLNDTLNQAARVNNGTIARLTI